MICGVVRCFFSSIFQEMSSQKIVDKFPVKTIENIPRAEPTRKMTHVYRYSSIQSTEAKIQEVFDVSYLMSCSIVGNSNWIGLRYVTSRLLGLFSITRMSGLFLQQMCSSTPFSVPSGKSVSLPTKSHLLTVGYVSGIFQQRLRDDFTNLFHNSLIRYTAGSFVSIRRRSCLEPVYFSHERNIYRITIIVVPCSVKGTDRWMYSQACEPQIRKTFLRRADLESVFPSVIVSPQINKTSVETNFSTQNTNNKILSLVGLLQDDSRRLLAGHKFLFETSIRSILRK